MPKPNGNSAAVNLAYLEAAVKEVVTQFSHEEVPGKIRQSLVHLSVAWGKYNELKPTHVS